MAAPSASAPLLLREQTHALVAHYQKTLCPRALRQLLEANMGWVITIVEKIAKEWKGGDKADVIDDLVQEGRIGLVEAIKRYDPKRGELSTCAYQWIGKRARLFLVQYGRSIRLPDKVQREVSRRLSAGQESGMPSTVRTDNEALPEPGGDGPTELSAGTVALLDSLPEQDRTLVWNEARMSKAEFARICKEDGITPSEAKARLARIYEALRDTARQGAAMVSRVAQPSFVPSIPNNHP